MSIKKAILCAAAAAALMLPVSDADAARLDDIAERGTIRVGTTGDYRPMSYYDAEACGVGTEVLQADLGVGDDGCSHFGHGEWQVLGVLLVRVVGTGTQHTGEQCGGKATLESVPLASCAWTDRVNDP